MMKERNTADRPGSRVWENDCVSSQRHAEPGSLHAAGQDDQTWQSQSAETPAPISMTKMFSAVRQVT